MNMARVSKYDAIMWLKAIKNAGYSQFITKEIKSIAGYNHGYLLALINNNYIKCVKKVPTGTSSNKVNVWEINDTVLKATRIGRMMYEDLK